MHAIKPEDGPQKPVTMTAERWASIEERLAAHEAAMDELRADLFQAQTEASRYKAQRESLQERLAALARERDELRRFRYELIQGEAEGSREVAVQIAARATLDRDRALSEARACQQSEKQLRLALHTAHDGLRDALLKCGAPKCEKCGGTGWEDYRDAELAERIEPWAYGDCEDCGGIGLEWYPEVTS